MTVSQAAIRLAFMMRRAKNLWPFGATDEKKRKKKKGKKEKKKEKRKIFITCRSSDVFGCLTTPGRRRFMIEVYLS